MISFVAKQNYFFSISELRDFREKVERCVLNYFPNKNQRQKDQRAKLIRKICQLYVFRSSPLLQKAKELQESALILEASELVQRKLRLQMKLDMSHNNSSGLKAYFKTKSLEKEILEATEFDLKPSILGHNPLVKFSAYYSKYGIYSLNKLIGKRVLSIPVTLASLNDLALSEEQKEQISQKVGEAAFKDMGIIDLLFHLCLEEMEKLEDLKAREAWESKGRLWANFVRP